MAKRLGIYIHIPFCASKCAYCDFYSVAGRDKLIPRFHSALIEHIKESSAQLQDYLVDTVYFGGGTPSYYGAHRLSEIFDALKIYTLVYKAAEVTCECNPDSMTRRELKTLFAAGFNRLSIGLRQRNDTIHFWVIERFNIIVPLFIDHSQNVFDACFVNFTRMFLERVVLQIKQSFAID